MFKYVLTEVPRLFFLYFTLFYIINQVTLHRTYMKTDGAESCSNLSRESSCLSLFVPLLNLSET